MPKRNKFRSAGVSVVKKDVFIPVTSENKETVYTMMDCDDDYCMVFVRKEE